MEMPTAGFTEAPPMEAVTILPLALREYQTRPFLPL